MFIFLIFYFVNIMVIFYLVIFFRLFYGSWGCSFFNFCILMGSCCFYKVGEVKFMVFFSVGFSNLLLYYFFFGLIWDDIYVNCFLEFMFWLLVNVLLSIMFFLLFLC